VRDERGMYRCLCSKREDAQAPVPGDAAATARVVADSTADRFGRPGAAPSPPSPRPSTPRHEIHVFGEVLRVAADAPEQPGLERVHPVQT
jgi:hypothetical protein